MWHQEHLPDLVLAPKLSMFENIGHYPLNLTSTSGTEACLALDWKELACFSVFAVPAAAEELRLQCVEGCS